MLLRYIFFASAMMMLSWISACPDRDVCNCTESAVKCICESRKNITVNPLYKDGIRHVLITGCGVVVINSFFLYFLSLESIELRDLEHLKIQGFALSRLNTVGNFSISNVQNMEVDHYGFSTLYNISSLAISNVSWQNVREESFGGISSVDNFIITNSEFKNVRSHAFILHNITKFQVKNSRFGTVENRSLLLHGAKEVSFENCTFTHTNYSIFSLSFVKKLSFHRCYFDVLATSAFFADNVDYFTMSNCTVNKMETRAFENFRVSNSIQFSDNVVDRAEEDSLFFTTAYAQSKNLDKDLSGNKISCNCNLSWLWENQTDIYRDFIETSFCIGRLNTVSISSVSSIIRSKSECSTLNILGTENNEASPTIFGTENSEASSTSGIHTVSESRVAQRNGILFETSSGATKKYPLYAPYYFLVSLWMQLHWLC